MNPFGENSGVAVPPLRWLVGARHTYECETRSVLRLNQLSMENLIRSLVEMHVLDRPTQAGGYVVRVTVLRTEQSQQQGLHQLLAALNQVSDVVELDVNQQGYAQRILNRPELLAKWPGVRAALRQQFRQFPQTEALLAGLDQQLSTPGALEAAILPHGVYGVLFAGLLGRPFFSHPPEAPERRVLPGFFGNQDLPLLVRKHAALPAERAGNYVRLLATCHLDEPAFDRQRWQHLLRQITDTPSLDATLSVAGQEAYELAALDGVVRTASQRLVVQVPQVYHNELTHRLTLHQSPV